MLNFVFYISSANEALDGQVKKLEATVSNLSEENSSLVKENAMLVEEKANHIAEVRHSVSYFYSWIEMHYKPLLYYLVHLPQIILCFVLWFSWTMEVLGNNLAFFATSKRV